MTTYYAKSFKDLRVHQKAREVSRLVFKLSKAFPKEEMYSLADQLRRANPPWSILPHPPITDYR